LIYTLALLTMITRIQLNLLGRRSYLSSVVTLATGTAQATISLENNDDDNTEQAYGNDFETNRKYLTFSWWLLNRGWIDVKEKVEAAVRKVFGHLSPRDNLTFEAFSTMTLDVRKLVEGETPEARRASKWLPFVLPPQDLEDYVIRESGILSDSTESLQEVSSPGSTASLRRLLDETADLVDSPAFSHVTTLLLDAGFSHLVDKKLATAAFEIPVPTPLQAVESMSGFTSSAPTEQSSSLAGGATRAVLLPRILSVLTRQAHAIGNGMPNEYLQAMEGVRDLEAFAAVVYSSNWENDIRATEGSGITPPAPAGVPPAPREEGSGLAASVVEVRLPSQSTGLGGESVVIVDSQGSFESAWERAASKK
jgi:peroxin-3